VENIQKLKESIIKNIHKKYIFFLPNLSAQAQEGISKIKVINPESRVIKSAI
jgi:hypothetical protein